VVKRFFVVLAVLALLAAACGGTTTGTTEEGAAASEATDESTGADESADESSGDESSGSGEIDLGEDGELSLDDFMPGARAFDEDTDWRSEEMQIQQQIADCMAAEGFEYIPFVPSDVGGGFVFDESDEEEYVKTYGFGIATWVLEQEQYSEENDPWANDPNREIVEAMDEFEREEYYRILYGGEPEIIENTPPEEIDAMSDEERMEFFDEAYANWMPDGCESRAYEEAYGGEADMAFWEEFGQDFEDLWSRAESDPRIVEAQAGWSACMAERGQDFPTQQAMYEYLWGYESGGTYVEGEFQQRVNAVITWPEPDFSDEGEDGTETTLTEEDFADWGPEYDIDELQPLIDEEIALATANYECSKDMYAIQEEVYKDLERQFIEENYDRLVAFSEQNS
jgi:hypothetical protein